MAAEVDPKREIETWECTTSSTCWLWVSDPREGGYRKTRVGGSGQRRVRLSIDDRRYNEEQIIEPELNTNPFRNGFLRLVSEPKVDDVDNTFWLTDQDLRDRIAIREPAHFEEAVVDIKSELVLRRLKALCEADGTMAQNEFLDAMLRERYPIGGTQRTVQEIIDEEKRQAGTRMS